MAMIELYLIRHGLASERGREWPDDAKRPLTPSGISKLRKEAQALEAIQVAFDQIISSPLVRARQTADVFAEMKNKPPVMTSDALSPAGTPAAVTQELAKHLRKGRIALVGHEPNLGELAAFLIGAHSSLEFKKGGICRIDFDVPPARAAGMLRWFVTPKILRKLAG